MVQALVYVELPRRLVEACELAISLAQESKDYLERGEALHPLVGAVILDEDGNLLSQAARREDGRNHAEVVAINRIGASDIPRVHTVVTTLEPCCYRKDPQEICCSKRIVRTGAKQVVIGTLDPAASVRGRGAQILQVRNVYFVMFPKNLQDQIARINDSYIRFYSELYTSGRRPRPKPGIVKDDMEFNLDYAPARVVRYLTSKRFWEQMKQIHMEFRTHGITDVRFDIFFAIKAASPGSEIATVMEAEGRRGGPSLFELVASYLAIPGPLTRDEKGTDRQLVYQHIGEWWYRHRHKERHELTNKLCKRQVRN